MDATTTPAALSRPWAALRKRSSPTHIPWDHHPAQLGRHLCRVTVPLPAFPMPPGHLPRSWVELQSHWYHPLAVKVCLVPSLRETGNGSRHSGAGAIWYQPMIQCCELPLRVPYRAQVRCSDHIPCPSGCGLSSASSLSIYFRRSLPPVEQVPQK